MRSRASPRSAPRRRSGRHRSLGARGRVLLEPRHGREHAVAMRGALKAGALVALALLALDAKRAHGEPYVGGFTPTSGSPGTLVKIIGEGLDDPTAVSF